MKPDRAAWVLVGGRSSRMGTDKAFLNTGKGPLAAHVAELAAEVCPAVTLVGDPTLYASLGFPVIPDNHTGLGPLGGIEAALKASPAEWNLIVACDMPALDAVLLESLFTAAEGFDCALPQHPDGRLEPLCAVYNKRGHAAIEAALAAGIRKVTEGLKSGLKVNYVLTDREAAFANWNTPQDIRNPTHG